MNYKTIVSKQDMEIAIKAGIEKIAAVVKRTLGPGGLPIILERQGQALDGSPFGPMITKDGVTVAEYCQDEDPNVDLVIQAVKDICKKTNKIAGDGTTTAIVLGEAILNEAFRELDSNPNLNPQLVRESIEAASKTVLALLQNQVETIQDSQKIEEIATISANGDREIGQIIRQAFDKVGSEGVITVDEGHSAQTTINVVEGFQFRRGAEAQDRFFNDSDNTKFVADNCHIIMCNTALRAYTDILPAIKAISDETTRQGKNRLPPILVIADDFSQEVIQFLLIQRAQAEVTICAVKSPHVSNVRTAMMDDMAVALGGSRLGNGNRTIQSATFEDIGIAGKVVVDKYTTTFYDGAGQEEDVVARVESLKVQKAAAESPYDAQIIADRIAALANGVAIIGVGGTTEMEIKERYHRIEDALNAARAAVEEGVIPGGGVALAKVSEELLGTSQTAKSNWKFWQKDVPAVKNPLTVGELILARALKAPFLQISANIGQDGAATFETIKEQVMAGEKVTYDARTKKVVKAMDAGIVDPFKVCRSALENAVSIAALLSTCGGGILYTRKR